MSTSITIVIQEFSDYMRKCGGGYSDWYIGIAKDARDRLFNDHNVSEQGGNWIYNTTDSETIARGIEKYFLNLGMDGGDGGGNWRTKMVY